MDTSNGQYWDPRRSVAKNDFAPHTSNDESGHSRSRRMVQAILIDGAYEDGGILAVVVHFAIWSSTGGNKISLREEGWGPLRSTVMREVDPDRRSTVRLHTHEVKKGVT